VSIIGQLARHRLARVTLAAWLLVGGVAACGRAGESPEAAADGKALAPVATSAPADLVGEARRQLGYGRDEAKPAAGGAMPAVPAMKPAAAPGPGLASQAQEPPAVVTGQTGSATTSAAAIDRPWDRMIIRNAQLSVQVENVEAAIATVRGIAQSNGGFVASSSTKIERVRLPDGDRDRATATLTVQVRVETFDAAIQALRALGKVESENAGSQDVTEEYVDLDSNLRSLRATETALRAMLEKATGLADVLALQRELSGVRSQIERIEGRKRFLASRSDFSSIAVTLNPQPLGPVPTPIGGWSPLGSAQVGWQASLRVVRAIADVALVAIAFSWWLVPFVGLAAYGLARRGRRRAGTPAPTEP
jgi:hypothetical protein